MARHLFRCPLRWADMDVYGIVNNVAFLRYLEEARVDFVVRLAPPDADGLLRTGSVIVSHEIRYRRPLVHRLEPVDIEIWVSDLQSASARFDYSVHDGDVVYATASSVIAPFDYQRSRPRRFGEDEHRFLEKYLEKG